MMKLSKIFLKLAILLTCLLIFSGLQKKSTSKKATHKTANESNAKEELTWTWISKKDGSQSCSITGGTTLESAQRELEKSGIKVAESKKGNDGKMHIQMCGADSGKMNYFKISSKDLNKAMALGYLKAVSE